MAFWRVLRANTCNCYVRPFAGGFAAGGDPIEEDGFTKALEAEESTLEEFVKALETEEGETGEVESLSKGTGSQWCGTWASGIYSTQQQAQNACNQLVSQGFCNGCF